VVVGFGPCGIFAALVLAQMGFKPIVLERGKAVRERTKDTWGLWRKRELNPESTCSSAKAAPAPSPTASSTARSRTRATGRKVLDRVRQGRRAARDPVRQPSPTSAPSGWSRHGREHARRDRALGGEIRFEQRVTDVLIEGRARWPAVLASQRQAAADHVVLALGHSARDTFAMLHERGVYMEAKPFSVGFRIEHPQSADRQGALGPPPATPAGRGRLQAGAPRRQWPRGLQLLHVPGRHRGGRHQRAGPRRSPTA
jgi:glycine/D-amino acid oxidase-like deaminating enzyme